MRGRRARTAVAAALAEPGARSWLARSLPGWLCAPSTHDFPLSAPSLGAGSPYPMCFLLSARVSCLLYSSHMVAGGPALPGVPLSCLRASSQVSGLSHPRALPPVSPPGVSLPWASEMSGGIN